MAPIWVDVLGAIYLIGRMLYLRGYIAAPTKRHLGFMLSALPILALLVIDLVGVTLKFIKA